MNERILELANKAGRYRSHNGGINGGPNPALLHGDENIQKFAELLIRECCQMMLDLEVKYPANLTVREIKKHFGVDK